VALVDAPESASVPPAVRPPAAVGLRLLAGLVAAAVLVVAAIDLFGLTAISVPGPVGLALVVSAHLTLLACLALPFAIPRWGKPVRVAFVVLIVAALLRFGDEWWSPPQATGSTSLTVAAWNLQVWSRPGPVSARMLEAHPADVVALEELTIDVVGAIDADPVLRARYPYQAVYPTFNGTGLGLLSRVPLDGVQLDAHLPVLEATARTSLGPVRFLVVHIERGPFTRGLLGVPVAVDDFARNYNLDRLRTEILAPGEPPTVALGDFNTASTDPAFGRLTSGLVDAHRDVGVGPGWTWRPSRLAFLGGGLIRIDAVLADPRLAATSMQEACPAVGDHCMVLAGLRAASG
jgi:vancomycin resistance protein VanJ